MFGCTAAGAWFRRWKKWLHCCYRRVGGCAVAVGTAVGVFRRSVPVQRAQESAPERPLVVCGVSCPCSRCRHQMLGLRAGSRARFYRCFDVAGNFCLYDDRLGTVVLEVRTYHLASLNLARQLWPVLCTPERSMCGATTLSTFHEKTLVHAMCVSGGVRVFTVPGRGRFSVAT